VRSLLAAKQLQRRAIGVGGAKKVDRIVAGRDSDEAIDGGPTHSKKRALAHIFDRVQQRERRIGVVVAPETQRAVITARDESRTIAVEGSTPHSAV
jgi:hypothetical protein